MQEVFYEKTIELTFKSWKSLLQLHLLKGSRPERIECLLYGRLITITILNILYAEASGYAEDRLHRELSAHKLINWLKRKGRLAKAIHLDRVDAVLLDLRREIKRLCKQQRKRKTTRQLLEAQVAYLESFSHKESLPRQKAA